MTNNFAICITILLLFSCAFAKAQEKVPLRDAVSYIEHIKEGQLAAAFKIYKLYASGKENKLITKMPVPLDSIVMDSIEIVGPKVVSENSAPNPLGGPLINALATVIASRFKEELTLAFLEGFREKLRVQPYLGALFPHAKLVLINQDVFNINLWLSSFRTAFDEDLRQLPSNAPHLLKEILASEDLGDKEKRTINLILQLYQPALNLASHPEKSYQGVVEVLNTIQKLDSTNEKSVPTLKIFRLLVKELGDSSYANWAEDLLLNNLVDDPEVAKTFIGFTLEKYKVSKDQNDSLTQVNYDYFLEKISDNSSNASLFLTTVINSINAIGRTKNDLKRKRSLGKLGFEDYGPLVIQGLNILDLVTDENWLAIVGSTANDSKRIKSVLTDVKAVANFGTTVGTNINNKEYSKIILNTLHFFEIVIPQSKLDSSTAFAEFIKYANLAVSLSGASTSEEMASIIESAALPVQSYRLKRNSVFSISVNSYAGIFFARETLTNDNVENKTAGLIGVTAPIGIGLNWGLTSKKNRGYSNSPARSTYSLDAKGAYRKKTDLEKYYNGHSLSLFASLVDVGALATFRLSDDQTPVDNIEWQNILAPGVHVIWGLGKTPLSLGIGAQYGPELRKVTANDGVAATVIDSRGWRFGISLTVDIPLLQVYSKQDRLVKRNLSK